MESLNTVLLRYDDWILFFNFIALCIFGYIAKKENKISSSVISLSLSLFFITIMILYQPYLLKTYYGATPEFKKIISLSWYASFAVVDIIVMFAIYYVHRYFGVLYTAIGKTLILAYFTMGLIQMIRCIERIGFNTTLTRPLYTYGIMAINYTTTTMIVFVAISALFCKYQITIMNKEIKWTL